MATAFALAALVALAADHRRDKESHGGDRQHDQEGSLAVGMLQSARNRRQNQRPEVSDVAIGMGHDVAPASAVAPSG
jgi:hypothetical protein